MDIQIHLFPRCPLAIVIATVVVEMRLCAFCTTEDVNNRVVAVVLLIEPGDLKLRNTIQFFEIVGEGGFDRRGVNVI